MRYVNCLLIVQYAFGFSTISRLTGSSLFKFWNTERLG